MKFLVVLAVCVAVASARFIVPDVAAAEAAEIQEIIAAINHPSTDPATAAALQQLLDSILNNQDSPIDVGPVIIDEDSPIDVGPVIIDEDSPIDVGPVIIDEDSPIDVGPVIIDPVPIPSSPLVQIIINVKSAPSPVVPPFNPDQIRPEDVINVDPVIIEPENVNIEEPIIVGPVFPAPVPEPVIVLPEILN